MDRSIPAWAGETPSPGSCPHNSRGLSPRGRGKHVQDISPGSTSGSIPAWAGETARGLSPASWARVYPRVGGGNLGLRGRRPVYFGLSPRGRGKLGRQSAKGCRLRSIPAWAGETLIICPMSWSLTVYPRVGGGNFWPGLPTRPAAGLSPRGRGKPKFARPCHRAGQVYPRVGGGNAPVNQVNNNANGLSPRGRGKRLRWPIALR